MQKTFEEWMKLVNQKVAARLMGLTTDDLPDMCYRDMYDSGSSPAEAASEAIRNAKES